MSSPRIFLGGARLGNRLLTQSGQWSNAEFGRRLAVFILALAVFTASGSAFRVLGLAAWYAFARRGRRETETEATYLTARRLGVAASIRRVQSSDRVELYLGLERVARSTYVLIGYSRGSSYAVEAGVKYYRIGLLGSRLLVRGFSLEYSASGTRQLAERERTGASLTTWRWVLVLKFGGLPMHLWVAEVYEGSPTMVGMYRTSVPKLGLGVVLARRAYVGEFTSSRALRGLASRVAGSVAIRYQVRWKRLMAYSGVAQVGLVFRARSTGWELGVFPIRLATLTYAVSVVVVWTARYDYRYTSELRGLGDTDPGRALVRVLVFFSLLGLPPRRGFAAKREVLRALAMATARLSRESMLGILVLGLISGYAYRRLIKVMLFTPGTSLPRFLLLRKESAFARTFGAVWLSAAWVLLS